MLTKQETNESWRVTLRARKRLVIKPGLSFNWHLIDLIGQVPWWREFSNQSKGVGRKPAQVNYELFIVFQVKLVY